ncbi:MAG: ATP-dependent RNA helicase HrpA [Phycisphaerales bacterium]|nr:ATP-dependent RNA helicase HrpA [Phycisphaerales bacterium]
MHCEFDHLQALVERSLSTDRPRLGGSLRSLERRRDAIHACAPIDDAAQATLVRDLEHLERLLTRSSREVERRVALRPQPQFPAALPVSAAIEEIRATIEAASVVIVAGETGSGKSTQLPKLLLAMGYGDTARIAHTQPRRLAARSVARRVAEELGARVGRDAGAIIGCKVRFGDETGRDTLLSVMTDGMLLAEMRRDPLLRAYSAIIVDEAHERSLNIDFLLGALTRMLSRRPELKVILTSATIDTGRLAEHFAAFGARVIEVPGRLFPIDVRYRSLAITETSEPELDEEDPRMLEAIASAVEEVDAAHALEEKTRGDILVFLSGERPIRECADFLQHRLRDGSEIHMLFARQAIEEQERIFHPAAARRIILTTNVAETSLTVPRIHAVIDPGFARISRYSPKSRVQRLPVERISQASARQRAGRAGRLEAGIAIRLTSAEEFAARPAFTPPEIQRTNLASVLLQMEALALGRCEEFPFVDPPSQKLVAEARQTLVELDAMDPDQHGVRGKITALGRQMAEIPLDPRLARIVLAGGNEHVQAEVAVITAALAVQDPRIRSAEDRDAADLAHLRFKDENSDFMSFLKLWSIYRTETAELGSSATRRWCEKQRLSFVRMREWQDTLAQIRDIFVERFKVNFGEPASETDAARVHRAILSGFALQIAALGEKSQYHAATGQSFFLHPSSALARKSPRWIVVAEIVETSRMYGRIVAKIAPEWIERSVPKLCTKVAFEPHWLKESGQVAAWERVKLGSLVICAKRRVPWGPIDPAGARDIFLHEALVAGEVRTKGTFLKKNAALRLSLEEEEVRGRRRGLLVEDEGAYRFYDALVPAHIHATPTFEHWRRETERTQPTLLEMREADLVRESATRPDPKMFPPSMKIGGFTLPLFYAHEPLSERDGVTVAMPLEALAHLPQQPLEWLVEGMLLEKVDALIHALPKGLRVRLFPLAEVAAGAAEALKFGRGALRTVLAAHLTRLAQCEIRAEDFDLSKIPPHLCMRFEVRAEDATVLGTGRDLDALRARMKKLPSRAPVDAVNPKLALERELPNGLPDEGMPIDVQYRASGMEIRGYFALSSELREGKRILMQRVCITQGSANELHLHALARLFADRCRDGLLHHVQFAQDFVALDKLWQTLKCKEPLENAALMRIATAWLARAGESIALPRDAESFEKCVEAFSKQMHAATAAEWSAISGYVRNCAAIVAWIGLDHPTAMLGSKLAIRTRFDAMQAASILGAVSTNAFEHAQSEIAVLATRVERLRDGSPQQDLLREQEVQPFRAQLSGWKNAGKSPAMLEQAERLLQLYEAQIFAPRLVVGKGTSLKRLRETFALVDAPLSET